MKRKNPESKLVPIIACLVVMFCVGIIYLWSVYKANVIVSYNWDSGKANMVASYMIMAFVVGCLIGGLIGDKMGPRFGCTLGIVVFSLGVGLTSLLDETTVGWMYLTYSIMGGLGSGLAYNAAIPCVQKWMPGRRGMASGLAAAAFGLSTVVFAPLSQALMTRFTVDGVVNFRPVFLTLAILFFVVGMIACLFIRQPPEGYGTAVASASGKLPEVDVPLNKALMNPAFWALFFFQFFISGTWNLATPIIKDLGEARGLTTALAVFTVSFSGVTNAVGRLLCASLSDKFGRIRTQVVIAVITALGALVLTFAGGMWYLVFIALQAFCYGGHGPVNAAISADFFGPKHAGANYGCILMALGLSSITFNAIANNVLHGNPTATFIMGTCTAVLAIVAAIVMGRLSHKKNS